MPDHYPAIDIVAPSLTTELGETFFFGVYSALFAFSTFVMLRKRPSNRTRNTMLVVSVVMYAVSAAHWALIVANTVRWSSVENVFLPPSVVIALICLSTVNYTLSDGIVLWRAWVLWDRRFIFFIPPLIFMLCAFVTSVAGVVLRYDGSMTKSVRNDMSLILGLCVYGLTVSTNLWATCLIFIRAWQHRCLLRSQLGKGNATSKAESALFFLVESGALYLCFWLALIITTVHSSKSPALFFFQIQFIGIYPTAIFVVVTMRMSAADILSHLGPETHHYPSTMIFTPPSPTAQPSILAMTIGSSSDGDFIIGSREDRLTRSLASNDPEKGKKLSGQDVWHD